MSISGRLGLILKISMGLAIAWCLWVFAARHASTARWVQLHKPEAARNPEFDKQYGGSEVKILNFYARDAKVTEGSSTLLCYGVLNAKAVKIEPTVEGASPALSRCLEISPGAKTRYTLTAEGADGRTVTASFVLRVEPDPEARPHIDAFRITQREVRQGRVAYTVYFQVRNALQVSVDPPAFTPNGAAFGYFTVAPPETTTYTLTAKGQKGRTSTKALTITVP